MSELAEDHGWTFAARAYGDRPFRGHGFCAHNAQGQRRSRRSVDAALLGQGRTRTQTCGTNLSGKIRDWRPYNPQTQNYPYALRQRWVRTFNDAWMVINQKVLTRTGALMRPLLPGCFRKPQVPCTPQQKATPPWLTPC